MDSYSSYPSDQCLTEVLDYWLRHHNGKIKWTEVADALKAVELNQLAQKAQNLSSLHSGKAIVDLDCLFCYTCILAIMT